MGLGRRVQALISTQEAAADTEIRDKGLHSYSLRRKTGTLLILPRNPNTRLTKLHLEPETLFEILRVKVLGQKALAVLGRSIEGVVCNTITYDSFS